MSNESRLVVNFQKIDMHEKPTLVLKTPSGHVLQTLGYAHNIECSFRFDETSELSFEVPAKVNGESVPGYEHLVGEMLVDMVGWGMFILQNPSSKNDGVSESVECKAYSLEYELTHKRIFLEEGTYNFWNPALPEGTIIQEILNVSHGWSVGYIDPNLIGKYRTFDDTQDNVYNVMRNTLQQPFGCIFYFDTYNKTINAIDANSKVATSQVFLSTDNLVKEIDIEEQTDNLVTVLDVYGADGVDIRSVNPIGNKIYNLDYFMNETHFDRDMVAKWSMWKTIYENTRSSFYAASVKRAMKTSEILTLKAKQTDEEAKLQTYETEQSAYVATLAEISGNSDFDADTNDVAKALAEIKQKVLDQTQLINDLKEEIVAAEEDAAALKEELEGMRDSVRLENYFTEEEYDSLVPYFIEDALEESSFVYSDVTSFVSDNDSVLDGTINVELAGCDLSRVMQQSAKSSQVYNDYEVEGVVTAVNEDTEPRTIKVTTTDNEEFFYETDGFALGDRVLAFTKDNTYEHEPTITSVHKRSDIEVYIGETTDVDGVIASGVTESGKPWRFTGTGYKKGESVVILMDGDEICDVIPVEEESLNRDEVANFVGSFFDDRDVLCTVTAIEGDDRTAILKTEDGEETELRTKDFSVGDKLCAIVEGSEFEYGPFPIKDTKETFVEDEDMVVLTYKGDIIASNEVDRDSLYPDRDIHGVVADVFDGADPPYVTVDIGGGNTVPFHTTELEAGQSVIVVHNSRNEVAGVYPEESVRMMFGDVTSVIGNRVRGVTDDGFRWMFDSEGYSVGDKVIVIFYTLGDDDISNDIVIDITTAKRQSLFSSDYVEYTVDRIENDNRTIVATDKNGKEHRYKTNDFEIGDEVVVIYDTNIIRKNETLFLLANTREMLGVVDAVTGDVVEGITDDGNRWQFVAPDFEVDDEVVVLFDTLGTADKSDDRVIDVIKRKHETLYSISGGTATITYDVASDEDETITKTVEAQIKQGTLEVLSNGNCVIGLAIGSGKVTTTIDGEDGEYQPISGGTITMSGKAGAVIDDTQPDEKTPNVIYSGKTLTCNLTKASLYMTEELTLMEQYAVEFELYDYAVKELNKVAYPTYTFKLETANFLALEEFISFTNSLELGNRVMVDTGKYILTPILLAVDVAFDDLNSLSLSFSDTYHGGDNAFNLVDLLEKSVTMGHKLDLSKYSYSAFVNSDISSAVKDFITNALDASKNKIINSSNQAVTIDDTGIKLRKPIAEGLYEDQQIWMINNNIVFTDDGWATAKMAIGAFHDENFGDTWGIVAPSIVGTLLAGENLLIESKKKSDGPGGATSVFKVDGDGAQLYNAKFELITPTVNEGEYSQILLDPDLGIGIGKYPITKQNEDGEVEWDDGGDSISTRSMAADAGAGNAKFWVDKEGNIHFRGTLDGADGKFSGTLEVGNPRIGLGLYVDKEGNLAIGGMADPQSEGEVDVDGDGKFDNKANFYVYNDGTMYAKGGTFEGKIYAEDLVVKLAEGGEASFLRDDKKINSNYLDLGGIIIDGENGNISIKEGGSVDFSGAGTINFGSHMKPTYQFSPTGLPDSWHDAPQQETDMFARPVYADGSTGQPFLCASGYLPDYITSTRIDLAKAESPSFLGNTVYAREFQVVESFIAQNGGHIPGTKLGTIGYMSGRDGSISSSGALSATDGVGMSSSGSTENYVICTSAGTRLQSGQLDADKMTGWSSVVATTYSAYMQSGNNMYFTLSNNEQKMHGGVYQTLLERNSSGRYEWVKRPKSYIEASSGAVKMMHDYSGAIKHYVIAGDSDGTKLYAGRSSSMYADLVLSDAGRLTSYAAGGMDISAGSPISISAQNGFTLNGNGALTIKNNSNSYLTAGHADISLASNGNVTGSFYDSFGLTSNGYTYLGFSLNGNEILLRRTSDQWLKMNSSESSLKYNDTNYITSTTSNTAMSYNWYYSNTGDHHTSRVYLTPGACGMF